MFLLKVNLSEPVTIPTFSYYMALVAKIGPLIHVKFSTNLDN